MKDVHLDVIQNSSLITSNHLIALLSVLMISYDVYGLDSPWKLLEAHGLQPHT